MEIRKFRQSDRAAVVELWKTVFPNPEPRNEPNRVIDLKLAVDDLILVAIDQNRVIGTTIAGYDGHRGWLYSVAVAPDFQRKGIGRMLVDKAIHLLREIGCIKVNLQVLPENNAVTEFYQALGFKLEDRISMGMLLDE